MIQHGQLLLHRVLACEEQPTTSRQYWKRRMFLLESPTKVKHQSMKLSSRLLLPYRQHLQLQLQLLQQLISVFQPEPRRMHPHCSVVSLLLMQKKIDIKILIKNLKKISWYLIPLQNIYIFIVEAKTIKMFSYLSRRIVYNLAKWSKPKPKANKVKETKKSFAVGDEKAAKLSKSEQELENKQKMLEKEKLQAETKRQFEIYRRHDISLEEYMPEQEIEYLKRQQYIHLKNITQKKKEFQPEEPIDENKAFYLPTDQAQLVEQGVRKKKQPAYGNYTQVINKAYDGIEEFEGHELMRRIGTLGVKLGMTTMWDKWGHVVPVTVVELDRVQVVQIKEPVKGNEFYQVQMGIGEKKLKKLTKPLLGHFVKARVPPKKVLAEFQVSKECLLPVGYMMTPRHYTPGMFVDVVGRTVGHGFQGTIKKYGFSRQPASHGNSVTTRVLGSTGGRQDPGRVFKQKKMYGQMGNRITTQSGLEVFKIDIDKNIVYLKGSVPGKPGTIIKMRDSLLLNKAIQNLELVHFPTFVEKEGVQYPRQMSRYCGERDPGEIQIHDNAFIIDDGEEQAEVSDKPEGEEAME